MKYFFWLGPSLFLIAELILPGGSSDVGKRIEIIEANQNTWEWGHRLIIVALALVIPWLARIYREAKKGHPALAFVGVFISALALAADYAIAVLQLLALEIVRTEVNATALLELMNHPNLMMTVFLPYMGFAVGFILLAIALLKQKHLPSALCLSLAGVLIFLGGVLQSKLIFILAGIALVLVNLFTSRPSAQNYETPHPVLNR